MPCQCADERTPFIQCRLSLLPLLPELYPLPQLQQTYTRTLKLCAVQWWELIRAPLVCGVIKTVFGGLNIQLTSLSLHFLISLSSLIVDLWLGFCFHYFIILTDLFLLIAAPSHILMSVSFIKLLINNGLTAPT